MKVHIFLAVIISAGLFFPAGFIGGAVLNRPTRQRYDSKIEQIRVESQNSEQIIKEKLSQAQGTVQGLEKEIRYLNNELRNMTTALRDANRKLRETEAELLSTIELKNQEGGNALSKEDNLVQQNTIAHLKQTITELTEENRRLLALCKKAGIQTSKQETKIFRSGEIIYRGRKRTQSWFNLMYSKFYDKIAYYEGKYIDIGRAIASHGGWLSSSHSIPKGYITKEPWSSRVLSVLEKEAVLIQEDGNVWHVHGLERGYVDGERLYTGGQPKILICTGTYSYISTIGAQKTVSSFVICKPLTKEQFAEAINSGFTLIDYKTTRTGTYIGDYRYTTTGEQIR